MDNIKQTQSSSPDQAGTKHTYEKPVLTVHGTVAQITNFVGPSTGDGIIGSQILISDRHVKHGFGAVDTHDVLARLLSLPVETWSYNVQGPSVRHIGPMAQDFAAAFGVGESDKHINMVDANGVTIAAIQALYSLVQQRDEQIDALRQEIDALKQRMVN